MCIRDSSPAALFGFCSVPLGTPAPTSAAITEQFVELFGHDAAHPTEVFVMDWRHEEFTTPPSTTELTNCQTYGHPGFQNAALDGRLHWAGTETSTIAPGRVEGALAAAERAVDAILTTILPEHSHP